MALSKGERYAFITNFFSNDVSSYTVGPHGTLTLKQAVAGVTDPNTPFGANDEATSGNNREFLYARNFVDGSIQNQQRRNPHPAGQRRRGRTGHRLRTRRRIRRIAP